MWGEGVVHLLLHVTFFGKHLVCKISFILCECFLGHFHRADFFFSIPFALFDYTFSLPYFFLFFAKIPIFSYFSGVFFDFHIIFFSKVKRGVRNKENQLLG